MGGERFLELEDGDVIVDFRAVTKDDVLVEEGCDVVLFERKSKTCGVQRSENVGSKAKDGTRAHVPCLRDEREPVQIAHRS